MKKTRTINRGRYSLNQSVIVVSPLPVYIEHLLKIRPGLMLKKLLLAIVGIVIAVPIVGSIVGIKLSQFGALGEAGANMVMPPTVVNSAEVISHVWQPRVGSVGSAVAVQGAMVRTEVGGVVRSVEFEAGSFAKAGDVLLQLDTDLEQAQLHEARVAAETARISFKRAQELIKSRSVSRDDYDAAEGRVKQTAAHVEYVKALIAKKTIRAPFSGQLGIRQVSVGQLLSAGSEVVSLQSLDPIFVEFALPQQRISELSSGLEVQVSSDAYPDQSFTGEVSAINPNVDSASRTIRVQATLANPKGVLRPGMFVSTQLVLDKQENLLLIPATAVQHGAYGASVFVIEPSKDKDDSLVARQQIVRLGQRIGDYVVVTEGVKLGEKVVSTGVFKLFNGTAVVIDNSLAPSFELAPKPNNT